MSVWAARGASTQAATDSAWPLITGHAFHHLGLAEPSRDPAQFGLFAQDDE
jgi:hypothetical protein